jgi:hypothetical protein
MTFKWLIACVSVVAVAWIAQNAELACAQGGAPLETDDPETPGDGHWEINLATIGHHTPGRWEIQAPDADINYGWGADVQLKLAIPWVFVNESGLPAAGGLDRGRGLRVCR